MPEREDKKALEEERRLFYVAATRAKNELLLMSYARQPNCSFITQFLERPKPPAKPATHSRPRVAVGSPKPPMSQTVRWASKDLMPGAWVRHNSFGRGRIFSVDMSEDIISINFTDEDFKRLSLSGCVSKSLIKPDI